GKDDRRALTTQRSVAATGARLSCDEIGDPIRVAANREGGRGEQSESVGVPERRSRAVSPPGTMSAREAPAARRAYCPLAAALRRGGVILGLWRRQGRSCFCGGVGSSYIARGSAARAAGGRWSGEWR